MRARQKKEARISTSQIWLEPKKNSEYEPNRVVLPCENKRNPALSQLASPLLKLNKGVEG